MSNTVEPVGPEDLGRLNNLQVARRSLADKLLQLETEKIRLMAASKRVDDEWNGLFQRVASERGIDPSSLFDVNPNTGEIQVAQPPAAPKQEPAVEKEPDTEPEPDAPASE